jgi:hypothetical protein
MYKHYPEIEVVKEYVKQQGLEKGIKNRNNGQLKLVPQATTTELCSVRVFFLGIENLILRVFCC